MRAKPQRTFVRPHRPWEVRLFNWIGRHVWRRDASRQLAEASILAAARRRTGLADFGDERFRVPLRRLLQSYREDARLHPVGRVMARHRCIVLATNRLRIQRDLTEHPEILETPVRRPLFVLGLPRTGTTLLYGLLSQDPSARPLLTWQTFWPSPPPGRVDGRPDQRIKRARRAVRLMHRLAPQLPTMHSMDPEGPEECTFLMANTFVSFAFLMSGDLAGYEHWLWESGPEFLPSAYDYYRRLLQLLQWRRPPRRWVLKSPAHLFSLGALLAAFPDGRVVQTHRDPAKVIPSGCSLFAVTRGMFTDEVKPEALGPRFAGGCAKALGRAMAARDHAPGRVCDVQYADLVADPIGTVRRIYRHFGDEVPAEMEPAMRQWLAQNPRNKHGVHRYDLEQFGLERAQIDGLFGPYCRRFGIAPEPSDD